MLSSTPATTSSTPLTCTTPVCLRSSSGGPSPTNVTSVVLATKGYNHMGDRPNDRGSSRIHLTRALESSLRRLGTDYIDLYQLHNWDHDTPIEESMAALDGFVRSGKVRYIGCSNFLWQSTGRGAMGGGSPGRSSSRQSSTPIFADLARYRARHSPDRHPPRHGSHRVEPARWRDAHRQVHQT
jgi:hypothetical protein